MMLNIEVRTVPAEELDDHFAAGNADGQLTPLHVSLNGGQTPEKW